MFIANALTLIAVHFLALQVPGGGRIMLNVEEISSIREVHDFEEGHYSNDINCVVVMTNGKAIGTLEACKDVVRKIFEMSPRNAPQQQ